MKAQKFLIVDDPNLVNAYLEQGWEVVSVTAQHVSVSMTGTSYNYRTETGKFAVVIQKQK
jgi:hypothetical protein